MASRFAASDPSPSGTTARTRDGTLVRARPPTSKKSVSRSSKSERSCGSGLRRGVSRGGYPSRQPTPARAGGRREDELDPPRLGELLSDRQFKSSVQQGEIPC